jgi:hypothetical protein
MQQFTPIRHVFWPDKRQLVNPIRRNTAESENLIEIPLVVLASVTRRGSRQPRSNGLGKTAAGLGGCEVTRTDESLR